MSGFLSRIQGKFAAKYSGRYFSTLLCELAFQDARCFGRVFGLDAGERAALEAGQLQIEPEWRFVNAEGRKRAADLAILKGGEPILLVEVKEADVNSQANPAQLADYIAFVSGSDARFAHVSRYSPTAADRTALAAAADLGLAVSSLRYRDLLPGLEASEEEFARMFHDYLKDIGVAGYQSIDIEEDAKEVSFFLTQALGFPHKTGLGKLHSRKAVDRLPATFERMFGNLEVLGEWVQNANQSLFRHRFIRKYKPRPHFDLVGLRRALAASDDEVGELPGAGRFVDSGSVDFFTRGALGPGASDDGDGTGSQWLSLELGVSFWIEKSPAEKARPVSMMLYAGFYGSGMAWSERYKDGLTRFPTEAQAMKRFGTLIDGALKKALAADADGRHKALKSFVCPC